ncbi:MAG: calcium/proton exchanger [Thermoproteota archaeon]|jgi:Ca2+:H+ antiporter|nr:calcium/proton exchanger [Thermoproteota archaeon]
MRKNVSIYLLLLFAPIAIALDVVHADHLVLFFVSVVALIPLAKLIGDSTEHLSTYYGPTIGSVLNVSFGNAAEIIIAVVAIRAGLLDLVKASITGAILSNILLIFGLSIIAAGFRYKEQSFSRENIGIQSSMLFLAIIGLALPTILSSTIFSRPENQEQVQLLSDILAVVLLIVYLLGLIFTFSTHKRLFLPPETAEDAEESHGTPWSRKKSFMLLGASMAGVVLVSEILVASVETTGKELGFGELFVGAIIVGIVGNAAEHSSSILLARKGKIDLSIGIAAGSGTQIALFVVPILVFAGIALGQPFTLVFTLLELATIFLGAIILNLIVHDGRSNWFEGVMLTAVYVIVAIAFFFVPD